MNRIVQNVIAAGMLTVAIVLGDMFNPVVGIVFFAGCVVACFIFNRDKPVKPKEKRKEA